MRVPRNFLRDTIYVEAYQGAGARGPTYGTAAAVRASIQQTSRLFVVSSPASREESADIVAIVRPEEVIPLESRVTWLGNKYRVITVVPYPDSVRPDHQELRLGSLA